MHINPESISAKLVREGFKIVNRNNADGKEREAILASMMPQLTGKPAWKDYIREYRFTGISMNGRLVAILEYMPQRNGVEKPVITNIHTGLSEKSLKAITKFKAITGSSPADFLFSGFLRRTVRRRNVGSFHLSAPTRTGKQFFGRHAKAGLIREIRTGEFVPNSVQGTQHRKMANRHR